MTSSEAPSLASTLSFHSVWIPHAVILFLTCTITLFFLTDLAKGQDKGVAPEANNPALLDSTQQKASKIVLNAATWLDDFFNDARATSESNKTYLRVKLSLGYSKNDSFEIKPDISGRIDLPHLSKKLNLVISASNDKDFATEQNPLTASPSHEGQTNREITTALQYFFKEGERNNISTLVGASFHYVYGEFRYRHLDKMGSWQGRFINRVRYLSDDGLEDIISYDFDHDFSNRWLFRTTLKADWYQRRNGLPHSLDFGLYQIISQKKAILYEMDNYFTTEDSYRMTDLQFRLRYRQQFLRSWLVLEISPQITFPEEHDRKANPGMIVKLEADIGNLDGRNASSEVWSF